jgi:hypothetical protein
MMSKRWMTFILVFGALTGTFIGTKVVSDMHKAYVRQLEKEVETLKADLKYAKFELSTLKHHCVEKQSTEGETP